MRIYILTALLAIAAQGQTFTTLVNFNGADGSGPEGPLAQGVDGNLYGTATYGGSPPAPGYGTFFRVTPDGRLSVLYNFTNAGPYLGGWAPECGLALGADGNFYGTAAQGGLNLDGTAFGITPAGALTNSYWFVGSGGGPRNPGVGLLLAANGNFYGTSYAGGPFGYGAIFQLSPDFSETTLYNFSGRRDGGTPYSPLVQGFDGALYGTTLVGGAYGVGTVYKVSTSGALTTLYSFTAGTDGAFPHAPLALGAGGAFYGTTSQGGGGANVGTIFKITPSGKLTTLHRFTETEEGHTYAGLVAANDGNLYGVASANGFTGFGTIFRITPAGRYTTLHRFAGPPTEGADPLAGLLQATDGNFYGTTSGGGAYNPAGTIYRLSMGLPPLVKAVPHAGHVGSNVIILGNKLTGASSVTFNGTPAVFTVVSATELTAAVPAGATSGQLAVTTPGGVIYGVFLVVP